MDQKYLLNNNSIPSVTIRKTHLTITEVLYEFLNSIGTRLIPMGVVSANTTDIWTHTVFFVRQLRGGTLAHVHQKWHLHSTLPINIKNRIWADYVESRHTIYPLHTTQTPEYTPLPESIDSINATLEKLGEEIYDYSINNNKSDVLSSEGYSRLLSEMTKLKMKLKDLS
jgi:hypothetical protein